MAELMVDTPARMAEKHLPIPVPDLCAFEGACGSPLQRCPLHQQDIACMLEHDHWNGVPPTGFAVHINAIQTGEKLLEMLRWCWLNGCDKERPEIEMAATVTKTRMVLLAGRRS